MASAVDSFNKLPVGRDFCRLCLEEEEEQPYWDIFQVVDRAGVNLKLVEKIKACLDIVVLIGDKICASCMSVVRSFFMFREDCKLKDASLRRCFITANNENLVPDTQPWKEKGSSLRVSLGRKSVGDLPALQVSNASSHESCHFIQDSAMIDSAYAAANPDWFKRLGPNSSVLVSQDSMNEAILNERDANLVNNSDVEGLNLSKFDRKNINKILNSSVVVNNSEIERLIKRKSQEVDALPSQEDDIPPPKKPRRPTTFVGSTPRGGKSLEQFCHSDEETSSVWDDSTSEDRCNDANNRSNISKPSPVDDESVEIHQHQPAFLNKGFKSTRTSLDVNDARFNVPLCSGEDEGLEENLPSVNHTPEGDTSLPLGAEANNISNSRLMVPLAVQQSSSGKMSSNKGKQQLLAKFIGTDSSDNSISNSSLDDVSSDDESDIIWVDKALLFKELTFVIAVRKESISDVQKLIQENGGKVVSKSFEGVPDFQVVPVTVPRLYPAFPTEAVTVPSLMKWEDRKNVQVPCSSFPPVLLRDSKKPLEGCVLGISGAYSRAWVMYLTELASALGAVCQHEFAKISKSNVKASTHLITEVNPVLVRSAYVTAAIKWGRPAVNHLWLLACAASGTHVPEKKYLVDPKQEIKPFHPSGKQVEVISN